MAKVQICLVSEQAAANLLAALDPALKPEKAVLVVTGKMKARADALEAVLKENGIKVERMPLENEHEYHAMENAMLGLAASLGGDDIALNITGGTKLMSHVAQAVAQREWRIFYVNADTDRVTWLHGNAPPPEKLTEQLRLRHYLRAYGFDLPEAPRRPTPGPDRRDLVSELAHKAGRYDDCVADLNSLAQHARDLTVTLSEKQRQESHLVDLLKRLEDIGCLTVLGGGKVRFSTKDDVQFVGGGWLEEHVATVVQGVQKELAIRDWASNLEVLTSDGVKNELDILFMARNRLFTIECKTGWLDRGAREKANNTLFKLAEVSRRIGGSERRAMLVSYRALDTHERDLAKALGIEVVAEHGIPKLPARLKTWVNGGA